MSIPERQTAYGWIKGKEGIQRWTDYPVPVPGANQALLKVEAAGLCQSDCHLLQVGPMERHGVESPTKYVLGHEIAGTIAALGQGLENHPTVKLGARFALQIGAACGSCDNCRQGFDNACTLGCEAYGLNTDGGFEEYLLIKNLRTLLPIPEDVSFATAAVASDSTLTPFHAIQKVKSDLRPTSKVLLVGLCGLGLNALQILKVYHPYIVATDIKESLRSVALEYGADEYYHDMSKCPHPRELFDIVFDFVGNQITLDICQKYVKHLGKYMTVGLGRSKLMLQNYNLARREVQVIYSFGGTSYEQIEVMRWISKGLIKPIHTAVPFAELPEYLDKLHHGKVEGRVTFKPCKL